ncbi:hypothetical protein CCM_05118 [Cordyceps militaris CM01]|uniref:Uncharacterized protein n=1 Tax=Cordyceps militaris (strain CM01) TaxID=983644 RepID=G3JHV6_CORMM|nr:uncharacterized protein CCM_05118 [Cordyceps militaris CM01]EGX90962.1 hypothetical protein CCM_05118 [Cordyceps militaris CM01]
MSYYENAQWPAGQAQQQQNNWDHQRTATPVRTGASAPQPQDEYAFSYQFDDGDDPNRTSIPSIANLSAEVDRAHENLQKSGKGYAMGGRRRPPHSQGSRSHSVNNFEEPRGPPGPNLQNFYAAQRHHQPSRGSNDAEQVMQAKRRMAAQRERELRNLHTEQQYQRKSKYPKIEQHWPRSGTTPDTHPFRCVGPSRFLSRLASQACPLNPGAGASVSSDTSHNSAGNNQNNANVNAKVNANASTNAANNSKHMSEEETRELIARQRSALYGEGPFADKSSYVDESGNIRKGAPGPSSASSLRGASPMGFDTIGRPPADAGTPASAKEHGHGQSELSPRPNSTTSPQSAAPNNKVFDNAVGAQSRTSTSSPTGASPPRDLAPGSKPGQQGAVAPIGTRPVGTPTTGAQTKRSTTPHATSSGGWSRGNGVWGQSSSGLGAQASVWG